VDGTTLGATLVPSYGTGFHFIGLTPDLRPGLSYTAPSRLEPGGSICVFRLGKRAAK